MFKLIAVTLAALFAILQFFGAPERRVEVARTSYDAPISAFSFSDFLGLKPDVPDVALTSERISDTEAVRLAMDASATARGEQDAASLRGAVLATTLDVSNTEDAAAVESANFWYVTGTTVNLRQGPGTGNSVVGSVTLGTEAEVLADQDGWFQIRTPDGATSGWIYGEFLSEQRPG